MPSPTGSPRPNVQHDKSISNKMAEVFYQAAAFLTMAVFALLSVLAWPMYYVNQKPWIRLERAKRIRATRENLADPNSAYYRIGQPYTFYLKDIRTIPEAQKAALSHLEPNKRALGYREVLELKSVFSQKENKNLRKFVLSDYKWLTLAEVDELITTLEKGFRSLGVSENQRVLIYAETRYEWFLCAHAVIRIGAAIATLYSTLGEEGLRYGIEETKATVLITSEDLLGRLPMPLQEQVKFVIYFPTLSTFTATPKIVQQLSQKTKAQFLSYSQLVTRGQNANVVVYDRATSNINGDTAAVILYTSGSSGKPKGVILTHKNFVSTVKAVFTIITEEIVAAHDHHCWYGFLPLAHILEFIAENTLFCSGIKIGYGTPFTMTDLSTGILKGQPGDLTLLKPTVMPGVPLVLERIRKTIFEKLRSPFLAHLVNYLVEYKHFWIENGYETPLFDQFVSTKFKKLFGGDIEYMLIGGAPLCAETQKMMRALLSVKILIGFGSTETCGGNLIMDLEDLGIGFTGAPLFGIKARLTDWVEGGYTCNDKPNPRGELHIGGESVSKGYFAQEELTKESFYVENGVQWFRTGDIAEVNRLGMFRIIDRKKDLIKLQNGEYVSLGKIEVELKNCLVVDNVCAYGDSTNTFVVALIMPNQTELMKLALQFVNEQTNANGKVAEIDNSKLEQLRTDPSFVSFVTYNIGHFCQRETRLSKVEIPERIYLCKEEWSPNNDLLTASMKIKRINIVRFYAQQIETMMHM